MANHTKKALQKAVNDVKREHPTLEDRLDRYREKRSVYDAKRVNERRSSSQAASDQARPVRHAYRSF